jgi:hypothetical protein
MTMRRLAFFVSASFAIAATAFAAPSRVVAPAHFAWLPDGWRQFDDAPVVWTRHGAESEAYATSWAYVRGPGGPLGHFPRGATYVSVLLLARCNAPRHPGVAPPLRLPRTTHATLEGEPRVPEYRIFGRLRGSYAFEVRVDVNRTRPTAAEWRTAARVVRTIMLPRWPKPRC